MGFIQENANAKLFILIVMIATITVLLTFVYQRNYKDINSRYNEKLNELNSTFQQLSGTENLLNKTQEDLTLKALREKKLQGQYTDVEKKKNALDEENSDLKKDLQSTRKKLDDTLIELDTAKNDLKSRNDKIDNLEEDIADLKKEVSCLRAGNADC
ncbi:MAG: hypothetical protein AABX19_02900 [Nanoarchaeota archaeon]